MNCMKLPQYMAQVEGGFNVHNNEYLPSIKDREFLDSVRKC